MFGVSSFSKHIGQPGCFEYGHYYCIVLQYITQDNTVVKSMDGLVRLPGL